MQSCSVDTTWENDSIQQSERPELDAARVVISGVEARHAAAITPAPCLPLCCFCNAVTEDHSACKHNAVV